MMQTTFYLARHGETEWNRVKRLQGQMDSPLTQVGLLQAEQLALSLKNEGIGHIVSSPLSRALLTAEACQKGLNLDLSIDDNLMERHFGEWQQKLFNDLREEPDFENIFFRVTAHKPPNGESALQGAERFKLALQTIAKTCSENKILIVTHGDLLRCFLAQLNNKTFCDAYSQYGNGHCFRVVFDHLEKSFSLESSHVD